LARSTSQRTEVAPGAGYRYIWSITDVDPAYDEHRGVGELTFRAHPAKLPLADRSSVDLRLIDGVYSWRCRNRLRLERTSSGPKSPEGALTPYTMEEIGYGSPYETLNPSRFTGGLETQLTRRVIVDVSFVRQDDQKASVEHANAFGLTLKLTC